MRLVCFGDSNTRGYDPRSYLGSLYDRENRWVDILGDSTGCDVLNWGDNGREVPKTAVSFPEDAQLLIDALEERFPKLRGRIRLCDIGTIIGSHSGPGTGAVFFYGDERPVMD